MQAVTITQISAPEFETLLENTVRKVLNANKLNSNLDSDSEDIGDIEFAHKITGKSISTLYRLSSTGGLPCSKRGNKLYFSRKKLLQWISEGEKPTVEDLVNRTNEHILKSA